MRYIYHGVSSFGAQYLLFLLINLLASPGWKLSLLVLVYLEIFADYYG